MPVLPVEPFGREHPGAYPVHDGKVTNFHIACILPEETFKLCRQASEATTQLTAAIDGLNSAQHEITELKALAAERQKRFVMLNGTFKKKEDGMRERAEAAERQMAEFQATVDTAVAASQLAAKVHSCQGVPVSYFGVSACVCTCHM